ncbi:universal stress protein [Natribacillus halophilus]|uniref:Universal stress protein n=1 Tax=Natribacillus halophilus TaxID=549003 RepID=A0A1G8QQI9_9BACI|nr:universal stress protein [Natribacillus halophilus]SDJ06400.1 Nucleotide-binding universal stress protein, UspA family [Natribacillus halophilus]
MYKKILVAVDGSVQSEQALEKAIAMANLHDAHLFIAHVIDLRNFSTHAYNQQGMFTDSETKELLENHENTAVQAGLKNVQTILSTGNPRVKLSRDLLSEYNIDLLVTGSTGRNAFERMLIGSVAEACVRHAPCDVFTVKDGIVR